LVVGDAMTHLIAFGERVIRFFENNATDFERKKEPSKPSIEVEDTSATTKAADDALSSLSQLAQQLLDDNPPSPATEQTPTKSAMVPSPRAKLGEAAQQLQSSLTKMKETIRHQAAVIEQKEKEKNTMANLASLGILTASFGHETLGWTNVVATNANLLKRDLLAKKFMVLPEIEKEIERRLSVLHSESSKIETFAGFALGNVKPAKRKFRPMCVKEVAISVFDVFANTFQSEKNVRVDLSEVPEGKCEIKAYKIDWESIFANLIANAVWAMRKNKKEDRLVKLSIVEGATNFTITFQDSGHGIEAGTEDDVFDAGFSTRSNGKGEIEGTGMGLFIVKSFVEENSGGTVTIISNGEIGGAKFVIQVPKFNPPDHA
jgi:signal transduction histidine kinase